MTTLQELKKLLDDKRCGLKESSDTNKTYNAILALFIFAQEKSYLAGKEDEKKRVVEMIEGMKIGVGGLSKEPHENSEYEAGYYGGVADLKEEIISDLKQSIIK
jgi:hypothetical protein